MLVVLLCRCIQISPPLKISKETMEHDVIVVGAGNAALCAALSAKEGGANVLILERASKEMRGGNSAFAGGGMRMVHHGLEDIKKFVNLTPDEIATTDFG